MFIYYKIFIIIIIYKIVTIRRLNFAYFFWPSITTTHKSTNPPIRQPTNSRTQELTNPRTHRLTPIDTPTHHAMYKQIAAWSLSFCPVNCGKSKPRTPQHNGKVERSHLTDKREFYQLLDYKDDVDLRKKINEWEHFYNFERPHGAFKGKTPYEILKFKLLS